MTNTKKQRNNNHNKTKKCKPSDKQLQIYCSKYYSGNTLKSFQLDLEKDLKKGIMDR